ncbi:hypothetical protein MA16_Dca019320 [Dendrobium catenatum]|uniref:Protein SEH1 n=1 Tax=Dendrobium catenatum TaxID=906689 RepID=A0A2I0WHY6_9ASPA|nr:hypothetical protein MA16_Dca019320 [Dendrobium catenatum]
MERELATLGKGAQCCSWNYCGQRFAVGYDDGSVAVHDSDSSFSRSSKFKVHADGIMNIVWIPPEFGDAIACICIDGTLSLWEEVGEDAHSVSWKQCKVFESSTSRVLDVQFGLPTRYLKMVAAYSDGLVKVYELLDLLELNKWQLQAEFQNVVDSVSIFGKPTCITASVAWSPRRGESQQSRFALGFNSDLSQFNSCKVRFKNFHIIGMPNDTRKCTRRLAGFLVVQIVQRIFQITFDLEKRLGFNSGGVVSCNVDGYGLCCLLTMSDKSWLWWWFAIGSYGFITCGLGIASSVGARIGLLFLGIPLPGKLGLIWEFEEAHQRWVPAAELAFPADTDDRVHALAWAPNIGRPFEVIAVASCKGIAIWHVWLNSGTDGRLSTEKVVLLSGHDNEIVGTSNLIVVKKQGKKNKKMAGSDSDESYSSTVVHLLPSLLYFPL